MQELMFVYLLPRKKIRSEHTGKNAGSVRGATAGQARQVEELNARAFASQRGSPRWAVRFGSLAELGPRPPRFQRLLFPGLAAAAPPAYKNGQLRL
jgi:hypothetical protein